jgi:hypothetical protein
LDFFERFTKEEMAYGYFTQGGARAHTPNYSINVLNVGFEDMLINHRLGPARSPDSNPCDCL